MYRDDHAVGGGQGIDDRKAQGGAAVDEDVIIFLLYNVQILPQNGLPAHAVYQGYFRGCKTGVGGDEIHPFVMLPDGVGVNKIGRLVLLAMGNEMIHAGGDGVTQGLRVLHAQAFGQIALGIGVQEQHVLSLPGQADSQVYSGGGFAYAPFFMGDGDDFGHGGFLL